MREKICTIQKQGTSYLDKDILDDGEDAVEGTH